MARWRTKLVLDFAYLLSYCQSLSRFLLLLEDDVVPAEVDDLNGLRSQM